MNQHQIQQAKSAAIKVTLIGSVLDLLLGIFKIMTGIMSNSYALVTDGIHSLSDLLTDAFVLIITRLSHAKPDREHPYGHGRFETLGTIGLGITLFSVACIIAFDSIRRIYQDELLITPGWPGLLVAVISILSKEWIYRYTKAVADKNNSSLLLANAWHSRTDAFSSIAVLIGLIGAMVGFPFMDLLAAIFVALMIAHIAWKLIVSSLRELVDTALPEEQVKAISEHVNNLEGIIDVHELRTRLHGGLIFIDLHVQVAERISVSEGHFLTDFITASMKEAFPEISDIIVHIDPEEDSPSHDLEKSVASMLPLRAEVERLLYLRWQSQMDINSIKRLELHYLKEKIEVELYIDSAVLNDEMKGNLNAVTEDFTWLAKINFYGIF